MTLSKLLRPAPLVCVFVGAFLIGLMVAGLYFQKDFRGLTYSGCSKEFALLSPDVGCESSVREEIDHMTQVEADARAVIADFKKNRGVEKASIQVLRFESRRWFAIDADELYAPGSLMKVPVLAAYLRYAIVNPGILGKEVVFHATDSGFDLSSTGEGESLVEGETYTIDELLAHMIKNSSNASSLALYSQGDRVFIDSVFKELGIPSPGELARADAAETVEIVSTRMFVNIYRWLYRGSYLTPSFSQKALSLLSETSYDSGIKSGVPQEVLVAHKYGVRTLADPATNKSVHYLSDCGIVYAKDNPYIFCVMTKGGSLSSLEALIQKLSSLVYEGIKRES